MKEYKYKINGNEYCVAIIDLEGNTAAVEVNGVSYKVDILTEGFTAAPARPTAKPAAAAPAPAPAPAAAAPEAAASAPASESKPAETAAAKPEQAAAPAADGKKVFDGLCFGCHAATSAIPDTPRITHKDEWAPRIKKGKETLFKHAIEGFQDKGMMPAKGGNTELSDDEVKAAVIYMVNESGGKF